MKNITPIPLLKELQVNAKAKIPSMIWGPPGVGKSQIVYGLARLMNATVFEVRANLFDPVDVRGGLKVVEQANGTYKTCYGVPEDYPGHDHEGLVILLIDELTTAPKATQNALLQLLTDDKIGTYRLPKNVIKIACGNRAKDRAAVQEMPTPVKTRFAHYELAANIDDWCAWAVSANIDPSITGFLRYRPNLLHKIDAAENASPTPRTWEMLNKKLPFMADPFYGAASLIGDGPAGEYVAYKTILQDLPDLDELEKEPTKTKVPEDVSLLYAIAGAIASRVKVSNFASLMKYVQRMPAEFQVVTIRDMLSKEHRLSTEQAFTDWTAKNADVLL